ncbi:uncharacterized protein EDB91DRAFT_1084206 [Suillus paluster]|uniref:uncharacterized protein n=1 Tax=Suillus paluster TaxID=48578 RepID=UPI001B8790E7|nr:uncharacterized protein EDB91DRAFT_1084206 [Suillus paluster]KAG1734063.1 hypothetical protein EDB91DRAFT_1084206 [Suillus paluster]
MPVGRRKKQRVVESDGIDDDEPATSVQPQAPCHRTNRPGAGTGGRNSQLEKIGNAIQTPARAPSSKSKVRSVIVPVDEPENVMAPLVTKKKGRGKAAPRQLERNLSAIQEASKSGPTATGPTPALHVTDQGRFGFQDRPIPSAYVSSKPLQPHQTELHPDSMTPPAQPYVHDRSTSQGASCGASCGASRGASCGASCGASRGTSCGASRSVSHGTSLHDTQADGIRIPAIQHPVVSCDAPQSVNTRTVSHKVPRSVSDQRSRSSIPINSAVQREPLTTITPHRTVSHTPPAFGSTSQNMFVDGTEEGNEEADHDEEVDVEEDDVSNEDGDFAGDDIDNDIMDYNSEQDVHGSDDIMPDPSDHDNQTYPSNNQVRHPAQVPDRCAHSQDEDYDDTGVSDMDRDHRNNRTTSRKGRDQNINVAQAPMQAILQSTNQRAPGHLGAPAVVPNIDYDVLQAHHTTNRRPHSPSPSYLNSVQSRCPKTKCACTSNSLSSDDPDDQQDDLEDLDEVENTGKCRHTKKTKGTATNRDATNVRFYPPLWQKLLDRAKANFRLHLAISIPFPDKEESIGHTGVCSEMIAEAIVQWKEQKRKLEKDFYPEFKMGMATMVFNDAATFRSKIKQIVLTVVPMTYDLALGIGRNTIDSVKLKATALLKKAMYLRGHPDAEGCASNFANVAVHIVCHRSFYDNGSKSLKHFTKFQKTIPPPALFLVGTIIHNVIYIYSKYGQVNGTKQTPIKDSETTYDRISTLFNRTNRHEYHGLKLRQMLKAWALEGMNAHGAGLGTNEGDKGCSEWDVDLD